MGESAEDEEDNESHEYDEHDQVEGAFRMPEKESAARIDNVCSKF